MNRTDLNTLSYKIIGCVYSAYNNLGPGLLESVYEKAMLRELHNAGLHAHNQQAVDIEIIAGKTIKLS